MRKTRLLCEGMGGIQIKRNTPTIFLGSNSINCTLERTYHVSPNLIETYLHAKYNSQGMDGIQINAGAFLEWRKCSVFISGFDVYRIGDGNWAETFINTFAPTLVDGVYTCDIPGTSLGANELSGAETYLIKCNMYRHHKRYYKQAYINHLGCFDNINRLRRDMHYLSSTKGDE